MKDTKQQAEAAAKQWRLANEADFAPHYSPNEIEVMDQAYQKGFESRQPEVDALKARVEELENALHQRTVL